MKYITLLPVLVLVALSVSAVSASATQYTCPPGVVNDTHHQQNGDCTPVPAEPTAAPTVQPTAEPTDVPTQTATAAPTATSVPTSIPQAPTATPEATSAAQAPSGHSATSASYVAHSSTVALCHAEDTQKGMDTTNGVQSVQVRNVQPDAVQEYLQTSGLDHLMVPGGDCGPTQ